MQLSSIVLGGALLATAVVAAAQVPTVPPTPEDFNAIRVRSAVNAGVPLPPQAMRLLDNYWSHALAAPLSKFGVTFEAKKAPLEMVAIDSMLKTPTEN